jgi:hypothetical protein
MPRLKKYTEPTKHLSKRVPASQLSKCHEIIDEYLTPFEAPKDEQIEALRLMAQRALAKIETK